MDMIVNKLAALGIPKEILTKLSDKFGDKLALELKEHGLKEVCAKIGINPTKVPNIDIGSIVNIFSELSGKDTDGDGKTGIMEAVSMVSGMFKKK